MRRLLSVLSVLGVLGLIVSIAGCPGPKKNTAATPPKTTPPKVTPPISPPPETKKEETKKEEGKKEETKKEKEGKKANGKDGLDLPPPPPPKTEGNKGQTDKKAGDKGASAVWQREALYAWLAPAREVASRPRMETALISFRRYRG